MQVGVIFFFFVFHSKKKKLKPHSLALLASS